MVSKCFAAHLEVDERISSGEALVSDLSTGKPISSHLI